MEGGEGEVRREDFHQKVSLLCSLSSSTMPCVCGVCVVCVCVLCVMLYDVCVFFYKDENRVEKTFGESGVQKKYSHIDLIHMIDGVETEKGTIVAGNRCYYLKVWTSLYNCIDLCIT